MNISRWLRRHADPSPSPEAVEMRIELEAHLRPRVERVVRERDLLLTENNYTARIRALYQEGRA
jgi:hypothetical protein